MFIDIAANLTDDMFSGTYHGKQRHESDLADVIQRAKDASCDKMIVLAGTVQDAYKCLEICERFDKEGASLSTTVGFHPTRCGEAVALVGGPEVTDEEAEERIHQAFKGFVERAGTNRVIAIGEFGLDYDRLHFCSKEVQKRFFNIQLRVATKHFPELPLLLHLRNAFDDFVEIIREYEVRGVVHSFTGSPDQMKQLTQLGLYIGINGCSLRDSFDVIPHIPEDKILIETDAPYCDIKPTHPAYAFLEGFQLPKTVKPEKFTPGALVKGRNEPCCVNQVAFAIASIRKSEFQALSQTIRTNTLRLFKKFAK